MSLSRALATESSSQDVHTCVFVLNLKIINICYMNITILSHDFDRFSSQNQEVVLKCKSRTLHTSKNELLQM